MTYNWNFTKEPKQSPPENKTSRDARIKVMITKLYDLYQKDQIDNDFACIFINSLYNRFQVGLLISDKQLAKLEEIFNKY